MGDDLISTVYGAVSASHVISKLGELCVPEGGVQTGPFGSQLHASDYVEQGTPIITVEHLGENRILHANLPRVTDEDKERLARYTLQTGDIVFSRVGSVDLRAIVHPEEDGWLFSGRCLRVRPDRQKIDPGYLSWFFGLPAFREHIKKIAVGATMPSLNTAILSGVAIYFPRSLKVQKAIAHILGTLDDKIELNRRMNETLEGIARAIFKSWFVDFDPVRANAEGRDARLPKQIADLFPDRFNDSTLGEIPEGWVVGTIREEFNLTMGQSPPGDTYNEIGQGTPFFQGRADFKFRYPTRRVYCTAPTRFANASDTLVSVRAPVGDVNVALDKCCIGRGVAAIRHNSGSRSYTYYAMRSLVNVFRDFEAEGTVFGCINKDDYQRIKFIVPPPRLVREFEKIAFPLDQAIENHILQSQTVAALRDALLPKLISGKLRVKDGERFLKDKKL